MARVSATRFHNQIRPKSGRLRARPENFAFSRAQRVSGGLCVQSGAGGQECCSRRSQLTWTGILVMLTLDNLHIAWERYAVYGVSTAPAVVRRTHGTMTYGDQTEMGGTAAAFLTTHWSLIGDIQSCDERNRALIGLLLERYWKPVYFYLRRRGYGNEQAKDLTQSFFHEVVLNRRLVERADESKGRFRSLLLHALGQYLIDQRHKETAKKRIPPEKLVSLDLADPSALPTAISESSAEDSYTYGWMSALLDQALSQVEAKCAEQDMQTHWSIFHARVVQPILDNAPAPSLEELCAKHDLDDRKKASNMIVTVKRCFQTTLAECVRNTVAEEGNIAEEMEEIMRFFPERAQHPS